MIKSYKTRFQKFSALLSDPEIAKYARQNGKHAFSRKRKMPLKDMLLCCLSKKGLTTTFELRNYFKEKGDLSMQLSVQGYLQQRKRLNPEIFPYLNRKYLMDFYRSDEDIRDILKQLCSYKGVEIIEGHIMPDHIHMLVSIPPKMSVSSFMGYLKGKSALMIFDRHANLKYKFGNRHFWSEGYYVSTVGLNEATIKKYIQDQEKYDVMQDKLSVKEYEDPFKGTESK
ncbi:IS200/IS605 family transposase [Clostridium sp. AF37-5AT]|nr:IS200/IS605 family transposase [Clostridium sp. AM22-16AC]RHO38763.1 IS200/IS605 family transposase [Clostridium sp. AM16-23]RHO97681.1 IS200/IS605 family transposase [Clostridium sp. AF37-5AT]RHR04094.1 IS200/IS605 family transposase [Clostridium sp. AF20-17LB]RHV98873.1 IS200/IS605 family transposase [Clostridium sp. OF09-10]